MEACNSAQSYFIKNDKEMYYEDLEFPAGVRSTNLCQEIGQVKYVFSDKTGTLTQNVMELKKVSIKGEVYGKMIEGQAGFSGAADLDEQRRAGNTAVDDFLEVLGVAHTAMVSRGKDGKIRYEVESPDEGALVESAAECGWAFQGREGNRCKVKSPSGEREYTILATNEFDSARKRMSVVVRIGEEVWVLAKGADNVMLERASSKDEVLNRHLTAFSVEGLRTLVFARRKLEGEELKTWQTTFDSAMRQVGDNREGELVKAAALVETKLDICGASAIEDKLQDGVPETIVKIREAGMKLWVLTGDKLETAQNIGYSSKVLTNAMDIVILDTSPSNPQQASQDVEEAVQKVNRANAQRKDAGTLVTGAALEAILPNPQLRLKMMEISRGCSVLIACRVSPLQKAEMVKLVRGEVPDAVTLAIGDGANDVPMIQEAHVGVGLAGREGRQAVNNSDFALGQFRYLQRLLLVHGRWNYRRVCKFTLFTFWRNAVQVLMIFYYTFISGFSGTSLFEDWIRLSFNFLCSVPIMATGCFDQDVPAKVALEHADLYSIGREQKDLNPSKISQALLSAITHSLILLCLTALAFPSMDIHGAGDYYTFGTAVYSCLLVDMNYRAAFITFTHNKYTIGSIIFSFVMYVVYLVVYPCNYLATSLLTPNMYMVPYHMVKQNIFWMCIISIPAIAMSVDMFITYCFTTFDADNLKVWTLVNRDRKTNPKAYNLIEADTGICCATNLSPAILPDDTLSDDHKFKDKIDTSPLAQQNGWSVRHIFDHTRLKLVLLFLGTMNVFLGVYAVYGSANAAQIRIHYEGPDGYDPWGTKDHEVWRAQEECERQHKAGSSKKCTVKVKLPHDMPAPVLLYYAIGPYYQNFNDYLKSEVSKELHGENVPEALRIAQCVKPTRIDDRGRQIVPCGMKATSMFNDTFLIKDHDIDKSNLAWPEDVARFRNPSDYRKREKTSWLYDRYEDIENIKEEGVKNEQFLVWMRPSALARVWNPYGYLREKTLKKGQTLSIEIESNYPMKQMGGWKQLVLTTVGTMGGRHHGFGYCLLISGVLCFVLWIAVRVIQSFDKTQGTPP